MLKNALAAMAVMALASFPFQSATAIQPLSSEEFAAYCSDYRLAPWDDKGLFCVRYIQGFIDGAITADDRIERKMVGGYTKGESFVERATRTRLSASQQRYGSTDEAEYCLRKPVTLDKIVDRVITHLEQVDFKPGKQLASEFVFTVLRSDYPCTIADS